MYFAVAPGGVTQLQRCLKQRTQNTTVYCEQFGEHLRARKRARFTHTYSSGNNAPMRKEHTIPLLTVHNVTSPSDFGSGPISQK